MQLGYEEMKVFMEKYFDYYNRYSQNSETIYKMDEFWGMGFKSTAYFYREDGPSPILHHSGPDFRDMICEVHKKIGERLIPRDMIIDVKSSKVSVLLGIEKEVKKNGMKSSFVALAHYKIGFGEDKKPTLLSLDICVDNPKELTGLWHY